MKRNKRALLLIVFAIILGILLACATHKDSTTRIANQVVTVLKTKFTPQNTPKTSKLVATKTVKQTKVIQRGHPKSTKRLHYYVKENGVFLKKSGYWYPYSYYKRQGVFYRKVIYTPKVHPYSYYKYSLNNDYMGMSGVIFNNKKNPHVYINVNSFKGYKTDIRRAMNTWNRVLQYKVFVDSKREYHAKFVKSRENYAAAIIDSEGAYGIKPQKLDIEINNYNMNAGAKLQYDFKYLTLLHELGHTVGLGHTFTPDSFNYKTTINGVTKQYHFNTRYDIMDAYQTNVYYISDMDIATALRTLHKLPSASKVGAKDYLDY